MELILKKKLINHSQMWTVLKKDVKKTRLTKKTQFSQKLLEKKKMAGRTSSKMASLLKKTILKS